MRNEGFKPTKVSLNQKNSDLNQPEELSQRNDTRDTGVARVVGSSAGLSDQMNCSTGQHRQPRLQRKVRVDEISDEMSREKDLNSSQTRLAAGGQSKELQATKHQALEKPGHAQF